MAFAPLTNREAMLSDYGVSENSAGDPQIFLEFEVPEEGGRMKYLGSFKDGALKFTLQALSAVGYTGKDCSDLIDGSDSGVLKLGTKVNVAVQDDTYQGKQFRKIAFVNPVGSGVKRADPVNAKAKLKSLNIEAELAKYRGQHGTPKSQPQKDDSDIPF